MVNHAVDGIRHRQGKHAILELILDLTCLQFSFMGKFEIGVTSSGSNLNHITSSNVQTPP